MNGQNLLNDGDAMFMDNNLLFLRKNHGLFSFIKYSFIQGTDNRGD